MEQNRSHAVMSRRHEAKDSLDDFPTPPWATRALLTHVLSESDVVSRTCLEPACGRGYMSRVLEDYFSAVEASDVYDYGGHTVRDFLGQPYLADSFDWVITNPPFNLAEKFIHEAIRVSRVGVAILARTVLLEGAGRYNSLFQHRPPAQFAQFVERVPMLKGRVDPKASTATSYGWFVWRKDGASSAELRWIPPCRRVLERSEDYVIY